MQPERRKTYLNPYICNMKKLFYLILLFCGIFLLNPDQFGSGDDKFAASNNEVVKEKEQQEHIRQRQRNLEPNQSRTPSKDRER